MPEIAIDQKIVDLVTPHMYLWSGAVRKILSQNNVTEILMDFSFAAGRFSQIQGFPQPYAYRDSKTLTLSVNQIPYLNIGDVWSAGKKLFNVLPHARTFENLESTGLEEDILNITDLDGESEIEDEFGKREKIKSYFINYKYFAVPERYRGGKMIRLKNPVGSMDVLIPCFECIRYFFLGSAGLTHEIFNDGLVHDNIYFKDSRFDEKRQTVFAHVPRGILKEDAVRVACMISDKRFRESASKVSDSLAVRLDGNKYVYPGCTFPLLGKCKLVAQGIPIKTVAGNQFFLVLKIIHVNYPLKFIKIIFAREGNNLEGEELAPDVVITENRGTIKSVQKDDKEKIVSQSGSSADASIESRLVYPADYGSAFGQDQYVKLEYEKKKVQKYISANKINIRSEDSVYATNSRGRWGFGKPRANIVPRVAVDYSLIFLSIFEILKGNSEFDCAWLKVGSSEGIYSEFPKPERGRHSWVKIPWENFRLRRCYVFSVTVIKTNKTFYFVEIERKYPSDFFSFGVLSKLPDFGTIDEFTINLILKSLSETKGRWKKVKRPFNININTISHSKLSNAHALHKDQSDALIVSLGKHYAEIFSGYVTARDSE